MMGFVDTMTFIWPRMLWLLLLVPLLLLVYYRISRRRHEQIGQFSGLKIHRTVRTGWRAVLPGVLMLGAIAAMLFALARPVTMMTLPSNNETIILAIDLSGSMKATDVAPSRLEAAQQALRTFIRELPLSTQVGIVTFGASAATIQAPTLSRDQLLTAVDRFELRRGTAIGGGIAMSLKTLYPDVTIRDASATMSLFGDSASAGAPASDPSDATDAGDNANNAVGKPRSPRIPDPFPAEPGSNDTAAIILLSDGQNNGGPDPLKMADLVSQYGVRIYTVGFGTQEGAVIGSEGRSMRVRLDEPMLREIASVTAGEYLRAESATELERVYDSLTGQLVFEAQRTEVSSLFGLLGATLALLASGLSLFWFNRVF